MTQNDLQLSGLYILYRKFVPAPFRRPKRIGPLGNQDRPCSDFRSCDSTDYGLRHRIVYPTDCIL
jgi:hypothetical protein